MNSLPTLATRVTLLARLARPGPLDEGAWHEFVELYGPLLYKWCRRWQLQDADARDVTQQVLLKLARKLAEFRYNPALSFRAWLRTLTHHAWRDLVTSQRRPGRGTGDSRVRDLLATVEAREDFVRRMEQAEDRELLDLAIARVKERVEPATWEAFALTAFEGVPAAVAAERLQKRVATVYVARSKVQRMLQEEMQVLLTEDEPDRGRTESIA
jgi:RNA polymerase sigma-70 factor (ECF subfamily)